MRPVLLLGGRVIVTTQRHDAVADVLLVEGRVAALGRDLSAPDDAERVDCRGKIVAPGFIDLHVHLREPGDEHEETIASGARAAAAGGFTAVVAMPNTRPPIDNPAAVGYVRAAGERAGAARVYPAAAITIGQKGEQLTEFGELRAAGAVIVTDDGRPVMHGGVLRMALEYAQNFDLPVAVHAEDLHLSRGGSMHEGVVSLRLGLMGMPPVAEEAMIARDLLLAEWTGGRLHVQHVSTARGVAMIREAKARGVRVTAEATPHHFTLTDEAVEGYRTAAKVNPPLRTAADREAVREGLRDGTLDAIATDHAPHHYDEKEQAFEDAPFGMVGLETAVGLAVTQLVCTGLLSWSQLVERMSVAPARILQLPGGSLAAGSPADVTVLDPDAEWIVEPDRFLSRSRNTPFAGWRLRGRAWRTIVGGRTVWSAASTP